MDKQTEQKIKDTIRVMDALQDIGCDLKRSGCNWIGFNPFREDKHMGSFTVSETKNICHDFSTGENYDGLRILMEGRNITYPEALRYAAAMYGIYVDDTPAPAVRHYEIRPLPKELPLVYYGENFNKWYMSNYLGHEGANPLLTYLLNLPICREDKSRLMRMIGEYRVGTSMKGDTMGWTIWPQVDESGRFRTAKLMKYKADGHRDKEGYSFNWMHTMLAKVKMLDLGQYRVETCLFGLHLLDRYPKAEVCIVESEKSALICSAFTDPSHRLWMATGGKSNVAKLQPLIDRKRDIVLFPDHDGYQQWCDDAKVIDYNRLSVSRLVERQWTEADGPKADIADIMIRLSHDVGQVMEESDSEKASRRLGLDHEHPALKQLIDTLHLKLED